MPHLSPRLACPCRHRNAHMDARGPGSTFRGKSTLLQHKYRKIKNIALVKRPTEPVTAPPPCLNCHSAACSDNTRHSTAEIARVVDLGPRRIRAKASAGTLELLIADPSGVSRIFIGLTYSSSPAISSSARRACRGRDSASGRASPTPNEADKRSTFASSFTQRIAQGGFAGTQVRVSSFTARCCSRGRCTPASGIARWPSRRRSRDSRH